MSKTGKKRTPVKSELALDRNIQAVNEAIARSMADDFRTPINSETVQDEQFRSILFGLSMMVDEMAQVRRELEQQDRLNKLRVQIWQLAADPGLDEAGVVQQLLDTVGPVLGVGRACLTRFQDGKLTCTQEWCAPDIGPSLGSHLPETVVHYFIRHGFNEISEETATQLLPAIMRPVALPLLRQMVKAFDLVSVMVVPCTVDNVMEGMIVFDICRSQKERPVWTADRKHLVTDLIQIISQTITQRRMEARLKQAKDELELRVDERTAELQNTNSRLKAEVEERLAAETQLGRSLAEKEVLLKEIHHRVKNNLQTISSLLALQSRYIGDPAAQGMFKDTQSRVKSIALIHEKLYQTHDLARIDFTEYLRKLVTDLFHTYGADPACVKLVVAGSGVFLTVEKAIPASLIVNELVSNAFKYAFPDKRTGTLRVAVAALEPDRVQLMVDDDGVGLPQDFIFGDAPSLGLQLVRTLSEQLESKLELDRKNGTHYKLEFKAEEG
jgi:two-component sensor histidine kinase